MKKLFFVAFALLAMSMSAQDVSNKAFNVRYVDENELYKQYIVAQQYVQLQNKLQNEYQEAFQKKRNQIETFGKQIETFYKQVETKYKNGQYKTQKAFETDQKKLAADQKKLEQMQENAQKDMDAMKSKMDQQLNSEQMKLATEIDFFLADFAVKNDYDAILRKEAAMFINPKWNITDQVAEGLNARYNADHAPVAPGKPEVDGNVAPATEQKDTQTN